MLTGRLSRFRGEDARHGGAHRATEGAGDGSQEQQDRESVFRVAGAAGRMTGRRQLRQKFIPDDLKHEQHEEMKEWVGGAWDATRFSLEDVKAGLKRIKA